jgi:hypothetical protein
MYSRIVPTNPITIQSDPTTRPIKSTQSAELRHRPLVYWAVYMAATAKPTYMDTSSETYS